VLKTQVKLIVFTYYDVFQFSWDSNVTFELLQDVSHAGVNVHVVLARVNKLVSLVLPRIRLSRVIQRRQSLTWSLLILRGY
jgi:hypothetical protein